MNYKSGKGIAFNLSGIGFWLTILAVIVILSSIGLGWLLKSLAVLLFLLLTAPVIAVIAFRWWFKRNVIENNCPVCGTSFIVLNNTQARCPSCQEVVTVQDRQFVRYSPPGTVDVDVIEVSASEVNPVQKKLDSP